MAKKDGLLAVEPAIVTVRNLRVILAADPARAYGVEPRALNQAVRRNARRFPPDFAFQLSKQEALAVNRSRSQNVTLKRGENTKYLPLAFTEHGAVMAASVLNSARAVEMSVFVVRAFLRLREWVASQADLARKLDDLERRVAAHDADLQEIFEAIRVLVLPPEKPRAAIGFKPGEK